MSHWREQQEGLAGGSETGPVLALHPHGRRTLLVGPLCCGEDSRAVLGDICSFYLIPSTPGLCSLALSVLTLLTLPLKPMSPATAALCPGHAY